MILAFVLILVLCSALSIPQYNRFNDIDSDINLISKKDVKLLEGNDLDLVEQVYDGSQGQIVVNTSKRKLENSTLGSGFSSQKSWSLDCEPYCSQENRPDISSTVGNSGRQNDDDILLHLSGDKDLYKFLEWTMEQLGSVNSYNASGSYYSGLNMWKKGRRETPLYAEEPKYIVVRREPDDFEQNLKLDDIADDFPFIPPRGRKYFPYLESILTRKDSFIPHRGKKDKLKDIFKYDELFFPHRGRKRTSSVVGGGAGGGIFQGKNKMRTSGGYYNYRSTSAEAAPAKNDHQAFGDWLKSSCDDITAAAAAVAPSPHQQLVTNQAGNINALVSAAFHLPQPCQAILADANDGIAADGHQDARALAACQKENDVKINGFDQSVRAQQIFGGVGAFNSQPRNRQRLLSSSKYVEAGASKFVPFAQSDQLNRLQQYLIRNKQWRDYYVRQMATISRQFPPF